MSVHVIHRAVQYQRARFRRALPDHSDAGARRTLQAHYASRPQDQGRGNFFMWHHRGAGPCKVVSPSLDDLPIGLAISPVQPCRS
jgi:hypothetical protein